MAGGHLISESATSDPNAPDEVTTEEKLGSLVMALGVVLYLYTGLMAFGAWLTKPQPPVECHNCGAFYAYPPPSHCYQCMTPLDEGDHEYSGSSVLDRSVQDQ